MAGSGSVTGYEQWVKNLHDMERNAQRNAQAAVKEALDVQISVSGVLTPVGTRTYKRGREQHPGYLKSRNKIRWIERGPTWYTGEYFNDAPYAIFVALGTIKMRARDFVTPGFYQGKKKLLEYLQYRKIL